VTYRESCSTVRGVLDHQAAREPLCGFCAHAEAVARISAEAVPERPEAVSGVLPPVTERQASVNRNVLLAALDEFEGFTEGDELAKRRAARGAA